MSSAAVRVSHGLVAIRSAKRSMTSRNAYCQLRELKGRLGGEYGRLRGG